MKAKITRGTGFGGTARYILDKGIRAKGDKDPEIVCGTVSGGDVDTVTKELSLTKTVRPDIKRPVWHCSLSIPAGERPLPTGTWAEIVPDFLERLGFPEDTVYVAVRHRDTGHDHVHILASRISLGGKIFLGKNEALTAISVTQELEKDYRLTMTKGLDRSVRGFSMGERKKAERTGKVSDKMRIKLTVDAALRRSQTLEEFVLCLGEAGVGATLSKGSDGRVYGLSLSFGDFHIKASRLGKKYSWQRLSSRLPSLKEIESLAPRKERQERQRGGHSR
jgi:hypothetical protein